MDNLRRMEKMVHLKIQTEPYFAFVFFKPTETQKWVFQVASDFDLVNDKMAEVGELQAYIIYLYVYHHQANAILLDRLAKGRNLPVITQYLSGYLNAKGEKVDYNKIIEYKKIRKNKDETQAEHKAREEKIKQKYAEIEGVIERMKSVLEKSIEDLKRDKHLEGYKVLDAGGDGNLALCGLVQKNGVKLAIVAQNSDSTRAVYLSAKQLIALIDDISKPIIIQAHKEADRALNQSASPQIIAYLDLNKGSLEVKEGLQGRVIATKDDITDQRSYHVDIDVLLAYYKIFSYEQTSKEAFEKLLYQSEIYSSFEIK